MSGPLIHPLPGEISDQLRERLRHLLMQFEEISVHTHTPGAWIPSVDLCEMSDAIVIRIEVPGIKHEQLRLSIRDSMLKIEGKKERDTSKEEKPLRHLCLERSYGVFARTIALKWPIKVEQISARLAAGILEIRLPKAISCGREIVIPITE